MKTNKTSCTSNNNIHKIYFKFNDFCFNIIIYNVNFYYQTSTTNLDVANATKIDWTTQLNLERQYDDNYNQAPVSSYTEYSNNDVSTSTTNTNVEYGTQTA